MALRWENPASTTHSLTPSPSNRPLIFWILTPRKKPEATGSAGRCEPGVGRFTDPHPLTCSFFTPYLHCLMFRQCRLPQPSPNPSSEWRKIPFSIEGYPMPQIVAFAGPPGPAFSFLPFFCPFVLPPAWRDWLSLIQVCRCPGFVHNWLTRAQQGGFAASLVSFPYPAPKAAHRATQGRVWFFSAERASPSP